MPSTQIMIDLFLTIVTIPVITSIEDIQSCNRIKVSKSASDSVILHNRIQEKQLNGPAKIFYLWESFNPLGTFLPSHRHYQTWMEQLKKKIR